MGRIRHLPIGFLLNFLLAAALLATFIRLHNFHPVTYVHLISEDAFGEYATAVAFALGGLILIPLSLRKGPVMRRLLWAGVAVAALVIAGEEVSWGQRLLEIKTPEFLLESNNQKELNFHNVRAISPLTKQLHYIASYAILGWLAASLFIQFKRPEFHRRLLHLGIPVIPLALVPLFLLPPLVTLAIPMVKRDEICELTLALAFLAWTVSLVLTRPPDSTAERPLSGWLLPAAVAASWLICALGTTALLKRNPPNVAWRLNLMAVRDYPQLNRFKQSEMIFEHLFAHPELQSSSTMGNYEKVMKSKRKHRRELRRQRESEVTNNQAAASATSQ